MNKIDYFLFYICIIYKMESMKKGGKVTKKKPAPRKVVKKLKITQQKAKQIGKVKTGAVVQIDLSRRTIARKERNQSRARQLESTGILPYLMGIQGQQVATQSNIERLQNQRDALIAQARRAAVDRVDNVREGRQLQADDAHERQRRAMAAERRVATELNVRQGEAPLGELTGTSTPPEKETFRTEPAKPEEMLKEIKSSRKTQTDESMEREKRAEAAERRKSQIKKGKLSDTPVMEVFDKPSKEIERLQKTQQTLKDKIKQIENRRATMEARGTEGLPYDSKAEANQIRTAFSQYSKALEKVSKAVKDRYKLETLKTPSLAKVVPKTKKKK